MSKKKKEINQQTIVVKKERFIQFTVSLRSLVQTILFLAITFIVWYILYFEWIEIYITRNSNKYESFLFSIIVSMTLLMFQLACGFDIKTSNKYIKLIFIILTILIVYYGYQNYGLGFKINNSFGLLNYRTYESNSKKGLLFFINNWLFWSFVFIASLIFMTRD
jgi:hypothetical protein